MTTRALSNPADVARGCLRAAIEHLDYFQACPFCEAGEVDDDGGDKLHTEECPLHGYDWTNDVEALRAWATRARCRGEIINRRATLGARVTELRARIPELEKAARKTPAKTMHAERAKVARAVVALDAARISLATAEIEWHRLGGGAPDWIGVEPKGDRG